ncbi:MAG: excinuclease ABC subunit UvrC [Lachnoclostridium sp.]|jgi:excinuclease ABC subunit C|nr:excinuclease ABC subunit UvrC [Lachnoclostridium sp.]
MSQVKEDLKKLPDKPGVYLMHDKKDTVIYVGKAINLKNRVRQYFQSTRNVTYKIRRMIDHISYFEYIITDNELEALILECNLIKEYNPKYNTMLKDGKTYPYLKVTMSDDYPRLLLSRQINQDGAKYYGPFISSKAINDTIDVLNKVYRLRSCSRDINKKNIGSSRPCIYYELKQCDAPCSGNITQEEYKRRFEYVMEFLSGNTKQVMQEVKSKMNHAAEQMEFEEAAFYRDSLNSLKVISERQKIPSGKNEERDIIGIAKEKDDAVAQVFFIRDGKLIGREHFYLTGVSEETNSHILSEFVKQMYAGTPYIPRELMTEVPLEDEETILAWLSAKRGQKVYGKVPKKGNKERLLELAGKNARLILEKDAEKIKREEARTIGAMKEIGEILGIEAKRVESFDISNINGFQTVGSMVVFENGKKRKNDYRKFRIHNVTGPDDYAAMEEMLTRRFTHRERNDTEDVKNAFNIMPDLIMMDGGKGQVSVCQKVLVKLGLDISVCGIVKNDKHQTRGLYYNQVEVPLDTHSEGFRLIARIQDETHRFAIEYHRSLRGKEGVRSILDDIEGIGPKRRKALMKYFVSLEKIQNAEISELKDIPTMNEQSAKAVYDFFHNKE